MRRITPFVRASTKLSLLKNFPNKIIIKKYLDSSAKTSLSLARALKQQGGSWALYYRNYGRAPDGRPKVPDAGQTDKN